MKNTHSIKFKIIVILLVGFVLPFFLQIVWVNGLMNRLVEDKIITMAKKNVENTALRIRDNIQSQYDMVWFYREDGIVSKVIEKLSTANEKELFNLQSEMNTRLISKNNIERYSYPFYYYLFDYQGNMMTNFSYTPYAEYQKAYERIEQEEWFQKLKNSYTEKTLIFTDKDYLNVQGPEKLYIATNMSETKGIFMIAVDVRTFTQQMESIFETGIGYILNREKTCMMTSDNNSTAKREEFLRELMKYANEDEGEAIFSYEKKRYLFMEQGMIIKGFEPNLKLWITVPLKDITGEVTEIYISNYFILFLYLVALVFVIIMLNKNIVKPIRILRESVNEVTKGNLSVTITGMPDNELGELGEGFNGMVHNLETYIVSIKENEVMQREVEVRLLQNQIKPHFVRNVLNTIRWLAEINGVKSVGDSIMALSNLLEYNFRDSKVLSTVSDEITYVKGYLYLQKLRFQNKFKDSYEIEDGIWHYPLLKLTFQPIVENCVYHGILNKDGLGIIKIRGYIDKEHEMILFEISDNGIGMTLEKVREILTPPISDDIVERTKGTDSIALWNINQRIQRQYGESYGIEIQSKENNGTIVTIKFPILLERGIN